MVVNSESFFHDHWSYSDVSDCSACVLRFVYKFHGICIPCHLNQQFRSYWCACHPWWNHLDRKRMGSGDIGKPTSRSSDTQMDSVIRRIDLSCKLFAPVVSGFIISFVSLKASALALTLWNTVSVFLQYWLLTSVYKGEPLTTRTYGNRTNINCYYLESQTSGFSIHCFGSLMTAALEWDGIPAYVIGIARGVSAIVGIAATFVYPTLQSRISTLRTGLWSIWSQWICLLV